MPNIYQRLHAVMGEVDYVMKEKKQGMRYSIVTHDAVTAKVRPILHKHGVVYYPLSIQRSQNGNRTELDMTVRFVNVEDGDFIDVASGGYGLDDQDKGVGKAISYAVKYALLKALGLETGDDPDEDQVTTHKPSGTMQMLRDSVADLTAKAGFDKPPGKSQPAGWHDLVSLVNAAKNYSELIDAMQKPFFKNTVSGYSNYWTRRLISKHVAPRVAEFRGTEEAVEWETKALARYPLDPHEKMEAAE